MPSHLVALGALQGASTGTVFDISSSSETTVVSWPRICGSGGAVPVMPVSL